MLSTQYLDEQTAIFKDVTAKILANYSNQPAAILALDAQCKVYSTFIDAILRVKSIELKQIHIDILEFVNFVAGVTADPNALMELVLAKATPAEIRQYLADYEAADPTGEISTAVTSLSEQIRIVTESLQ